ncbi:uncharacterized protein PG986_012510 [Apiospora aurea]|uniref:Uncharacterized protein n=1 Tax=Apiospora aurea TaxID=335848 RepID=A0ABR1Q070_9PEZI
MALFYTAGSVMDEALQRLGITPVTLGPKEGLSLTNGTAPSAAVASLAGYDANNLCMIGQLLTAMTAEGLGANARPHGGQMEAAHNTRDFLKGSQLTTGLGARATQEDHRLPVPKPHQLSAIMEGQVRSKDQGKCPTPERVEKEGRQYLDAQRNLEENRQGTSSREIGTKIKKRPNVGPITIPGNREGIWDDDGKGSKFDWISQNDEVEKAIESPSGARFYRHDD